MSNSTLTQIIPIRYFYFSFLSHIIIDTGYLAAMTDTCTMDIQAVKGVKNIFFGGEGFFHTKVTGPGKVYIQSMPVINTTHVLSPYLTIDTDNDDEGNRGGGINIRLGN